MIETNSSREGFFTIALNRPDKANALTAGMIAQLIAAVRAAVDDIAAQLNLAQVPGSSEGNRIIPAKEITAFVQTYVDQYLPQR